MSDCIRTREIRRKRQVNARNQEVTFADAPKREVLIMEAHMARLHERQAAKRKIIADRDQLMKEMHEMEERDKPLQALKR